MSRILLITGVFPPQIGGPASFIDRLGAGLAGRGKQVTVVCSSDDATDPQDRVRPFRVVRVRHSRTAKIRQRIAIFREIRHHPLVLVNGLEHAACQMSQLAGTRYVVKIVGDRVWETARNRGWTRLDVDAFQLAPPTDRKLRRLAERRRRFLERASCVITPSQYLRCMVVGWGMEPARVAVVPNGVPLQQFADFEPQRRVDGPLRVAFVERLTNWKGVDTLIRAVAGLADVELHVIGDGPEQAALEALTKSVEVDDRVILRGRLAGADLQQAVGACHVLALLSEYEGLSHTLLEAAASGLALLASDRGGNPEVVEHERTGLLVPCGNVAATRAEIARLRDDEALRFRLAHQAKEASRRFDFNQTIAGTLAVLEREAAA